MEAASDRYYVPHSTNFWPIVGSVGLFSAVLGFSMWLNQTSIGSVIAWLGVIIVLVMMFGWFGTVIRESERGMYNTQVDKSFRWGMSWFIFSEVAFFAAFFGALFYARQLAVPWLAGEGNNFYTNLVLWEGFENSWPSVGPAGRADEFETIPAWGIPALNTGLLLTSGVTLTIAHHMLRANRRVATAIWLAATFVLGFVFLGFQAEEYIHAYQDLNLRLDSGIYGSTFFMLTGFHGVHVTIGAIMLVIVWLRVLRGHFTPDRHFAFEAVAWYWHFVDVVWLGLFIFVYWL